MTYLVDIHTHILPGIDDGSKNVEMSIAMLKEEKKQGVDLVVLTPHFYCCKETVRSFLERREISYQKLKKAMAECEEDLPRVVLGAEAQWGPNMAQWEDLSALCIEDSGYMLLEMPFGKWSSDIFSDIYEIMDRHGITPIFAHLERYVKGQKREHIDEIMSLGTPIQFSCEPLLHMFGKRTQIKMMQQTDLCLLGSDCHNMDTRPPLLKQGMTQARKHAGKDVYQHLLANPMKILGDRGI